VSVQALKGWAFAVGGFPLLEGSEPVCCLPRRGGRLTLPWEAFQSLRVPIQARERIGTLRMRVRARARARTTTLPRANAPFPFPRANVPFRRASTASRICPRTSATSRFGARTHRFRFHARTKMLRKMPNFSSRGAAPPAPPAMLCHLLGPSRRVSVRFPTYS
jgi:hypothetical protein